jgi:hypothetical protein
LIYRDTIQLKFGSHKTNEAGSMEWKLAFFLLNFFVVRENLWINIEDIYLCKFRGGNNTIVLKVFQNDLIIQRFRLYNFFFFWSVYTNHHHTKINIQVIIESLDTWVIFIRRQRYEKKKKKSKQNLSLSC